MKLSNKLNTKILALFLVISLFLIIPASFASEDIALDESPDVSLDEETAVPTLEASEPAEIVAENNAIYVNAENGTDDGTGTADSPVKTINKGIGLSTNGGTIYLSGTFTGTGNLGLTLTGKQLTFTGLESAVVDGESSNSFAIVSSGTYTFNNITFINNYKTSSDRAFGGVFENSGTLNFNNCWFENNIVKGQNRGNGGVIDNNEGATVTVRNSTFIENYAQVIDSAGNRKNAADGGAISNLGTVYVYDTSFIRNNAMRNGGAIRSQDGAKTYITNCVFDENIAAYHQSGGTYGGAVYTWDIEALEIINSSFTNNRICEEKGNTAMGGAIACIRGGGDITIEGCEFINNTASGKGTTSGQSVYVEVPSTINYCAFDTSIYVATDKINLDNNWWAVDGAPSALIESIPSSVKINKYAVLKIGSDKNIANLKENIDVSVGLFWNGTDDQTDMNLLPPRTVELTGADFTIKNETGELTNGAFQTTVAPQKSGNKVLTATVDNIAVNLEIQVKAPSSDIVYVNSTTGTSSGIGTASDPVKTIQEGLNIVTENGKLILTGEFIGTGNTGLTISKNIQIIGVDGATINANGTGRFATITKGATLTDLNVINCLSTGSQVYGGAISNSGSSTLTIERCNFTNNTVFGVTRGNGGVIDNDGGTIYIYNSLFENNKATVSDSASYRKNAADGGAISNLGKLYVYNTTFINNSALRNGGAIRAQGAGTYIENCTFIENYATGHESGGSYGGAFYSWGEPFNVYNSTFISNWAYDVMGNNCNGGALYAVRVADTNIIGCEFEDNYASGKTGATGQSIFLESTKANINYCAIDTTLYANGNSIDVNNNWWYTNTPDFSQIFESGSKVITPTSYAVVNITSDSTTSPEMNIAVSLSWNDGNQTDIDKIPARAVALTSEQGVFDQDTGILTDGLFETGFTLTSIKNVTVTATVDDVPVVLDLGDVAIPLPMSVNDTEIIVGETATITVATTEDTTGDVVIDYNGNEYKGTFEDGIATIEIPELEAGNYAFTVQFLGDDWFAPTNATANVKVNKKEETSIILSAINGLELTCVLKDSNGLPIANKTIQYSYEGVNGTLQTNEKGEFTFPVISTCVVSMIFEGDKYYTSANTTITLKNIRTTPKTTIIDVPTTMTKTAVDYNAGEKGTMFYFYLKDGDGKGVANKAVKIGIFDKIYTVKTDKNGRAGLQINIANANYYTYGISFLGDDDYKAPFAVCSLQIVKKSVTITPAKTSYSFKTSAKTKTVTATLKSTNSYIPKGKQVTLTIAGKTFKATIGDKGQISFNIGSITAKGTYNVAIKFAGTNTYASATSKTISVKIS